MRLETILCRRHQRRHCRLVGNGTVGLVLAMRALGLTGRRVAMPNSVCANVPLAILFAGSTPVFVDVSMTDLGMSASALAAAGCDGAIAVHAYGNPCDIGAIERACAVKGVPLIEDAAVAQGVSVDGRPAGSFGAVSVVSFGAGKVVEAGTGGAVLTDDDGVFEAIGAADDELAAPGDAAGATMNDLGRYHTQLYNRHYLGGDRDALPALFTERALAARDAFLHRFPTAAEPRVSARLDQLDRLVAARRDAAARFDDRFRAVPGVESVPRPAGAVPWRYNVLLSERRDATLRALLTEREKISSWFPPADVFFESRSASSVDTPVADALGERLLNLWVDDSVDAGYGVRIAGRIAALAEPAPSPSSLA